MAGLQQQHQWRCIQNWWTSCQSSMAVSSSRLLAAFLSISGWFSTSCELAVNTTLRYFVLCLFSSQSSPQHCTDLDLVRISCTNQFLCEFFFLYFFAIVQCIGLSWLTMIFFNLHYAFCVVWYCTIIWYSCLYLKTGCFNCPVSNGMTWYYTIWSAYRVLKSLRKYSGVAELVPQLSNSCWLRYCRNKNVRGLTKFSNRLICICFWFVVRCFYVLLSLSCRRFICYIIH